MKNNKKKKLDHWPAAHGQVFVYRFFLRLELKSSQVTKIIQFSNRNAGLNSTFLRVTTSLKASEIHIFKNHFFFFFVMLGKKPIH